MVLSTAMLIGSLVSALASAGAGIGSMIYNKKEAQRNRDFQERMSNTAIQRSVADAQQAGISPAMVLGGASQPMGATANANSGLEHAFANTASMLTNYILEDRKLDAMEKMQAEQLQNRQLMQNERLEHTTQMQQMKMNNTANFMKHDFSKEDLNSLFDNLDDVKLTK